MQELTFPGGSHVTERVAGTSQVEAGIEPHHSKCGSWISSINVT